MVTWDHAAGVTDTCDGTYGVGGKGSVIEILPHLKKSLLQIIGLKQNCKTFTKRERETCFFIFLVFHIYIFFCISHFYQKSTNKIFCWQYLFHYLQLRKLRIWFTVQLCFASTEGKFENKKKKRKFFYFWSIIFYPLVQVLPFFYVHWVTSPYLHISYRPYAIWGGGSNGFFKLLFCMFDIPPLISPPPPPPTFPLYALHAMPYLECKISFLV